MDSAQEKGIVLSESISKDLEVALQLLLKLAILSISACQLKAVLLLD